MAEALPELIVPGELFIPDGTPATYAVLPGGMPNGDDCLRFDHSTTPNSDLFQAFQDSIGAGGAARADHLLTDAACAMSFWIRRLGSWGDGTTFSSTTGSVTTGALDTEWKFMSVGNPAETDLSPNARNMSWALITAAWDGLQMVQLGFLPSNNYYHYVSPRATFDSNVWHLVVVNREAADFTNVASTDRGRATLWKDAQPYFYNYSNWKLYPTPSTPQKFTLGDASATLRSFGGNSVAPLFDIGKLAFHNRELTQEEMADMFDSMFYGPGT